MNEFTFEQSPWDMTLSTLRPGGTLSAARFIALLEQSDETEAEQAAQDLESRGVMLDVSTLPKLASGAKMSERLALETKLYREGTLLPNLEDNDPLKLAIQQMEFLNPISDEQALAQKAANGSQYAMEQLTQGYLPEVFRIAGEYIDKGVLLVDLMQEGSLGLWQAVLNYESGSFRDHADWWIRQAMARAVTLQAHANGVGSHIAEAMDRYRKADRALLTRLGRNPVDEEIALEMNVTAEEASAIGKMLREVENMEKVRQTQEPREPEADDDQAVEDTAQFQTRQRINEMLSALSEEDARLITLRYGLDGKAPMTAAEVGRKLGLTAEEVTAREAKALASLRNE